MPSERGNTLEFNQYMKSNKIPYIIYVDIESLIKKSRWMCKQSRKFFNDKNKRDTIDTSAYSASAPTALSPRVHKIRLINFALWETVTYCPMEICFCCLHSTLLGNPPGLP